MKATDRPSTLMAALIKQLDSREPKTLEANGETAYRLMKQITENMVQQISYLSPDGTKLLQAASFCLEAYINSGYSLPSKKAKKIALVHDTALAVLNITALMVPLAARWEELKQGEQRPGLAGDSPLMDIMESIFGETQPPETTDPTDTCPCPACRMRRRLEKATSGKQARD